MSEITYEILKSLCVLCNTGKGWTKEINLVSWNGGPAKLDIREWDHSNDKMKKGITLFRDEVEKLKSILDNLNMERIDDKTSRSGIYTPLNDEDELVAF